MPAPVIQTERLSLKAGRRWLLSGIDWTVERGENWLVFGSNGCGKTTLLSVLAGFRQPTAGTLKVFGEPYTAENILAQRKRVGWVSASFFDPIYTRESALDIVLSGKFGTVGLNYDIDERDIRHAKDLMEELRLKERIFQPFHQMSKGERQNVLIARALMGSPELLALDEPCTGLDIAAREHLLNTVRDLAEKTSMTILYVTHHTDEIMADVFPQTMLLREGKSYRQGATTDLFTTEEISGFFGVPTDLTPGRTRGYEATVSTVSHLADIVEGGAR